MANLDDLRRRITKGAEDRVRASASILQRLLQDKAPVADDGGGTMRGSITATSNGLRLDVIVAVDYATFTIEDTQPHEIVARRAQALRFFWAKVGPPQPRFFQKVQHPGTSGTVNWYNPILDEWSKILGRLDVA